MTNVALSWLSIDGLFPDWPIRLTLSPLCLPRHWEVPTSEGRGFPFILFYYNNLVPPLTTPHFIRLNPLPHRLLSAAMTTCVSSLSVLASSSSSLLLFLHPQSQGDVTRSCGAGTHRL